MATIPKDGLDTVIPPPTNGNLEDGPGGIIYVPLCYGQRCAASSFAWGVANADGCLFFFVRAPKVVEALRGVKVVGEAAGTEHMLCVTDAGVVYAWGSNTKGCCGVTQGVLTPSTPAKVVSTRGNPSLRFWYSQVGSKLPLQWDLCSRAQDQRIHTWLRYAYQPQSLPEVSKAGTLFLWIAIITLALHCALMDRCT